jgi:hypothetical protein
MLARCVISGLRTLLPSTEMGIYCETVLAVLNLVDLGHSYLSVRPSEFLFLSRRSFSVSSFRPICKIRPHGKTPAVAASI